MSWLSFSNCESIGVWIQYYNLHYTMDMGILQVDVLYQSSILATAEYVFATVSYTLRD